MQASSLTYKCRVAARADLVRGARRLVYIHNIVCNVGFYPIQPRVFFENGSFSLKRPFSLYIGGPVKKRRAVLPFSF